MLADEPIRIRPVAPNDDIAALTRLLHRSYAVLGNAGLNYTAVDQTEDVTRSRLASGLGLVAVDAAGTIVGTIVYHAPLVLDGTPWFQRGDVAHFAQFAVEPALQGGGVGSQLLAYVETTAKTASANEIALDTAESASELIGWYTRRGYRFIEHAQWRGKRYRSVILSKSLRGPD